MLFIYRLFQISFRFFDKLQKEIIRFSLLSCLQPLNNLIHCQHPLLQWYIYYNPRINIHTSLSSRDHSLHQSLLLVLSMLWFWTNGQRRVDTILMSYRVLYCWQNPLCSAYSSLHVAFQSENKDDTQITTMIFFSVLLPGKQKRIESSVVNNERFHSSL